MTLYEHLPDAVRQVVDDIVEVLRHEPWPDRFAALYVLLCDKLEERTGSDRLHLLQEWCGIVTAVLEQLSPDSAVVECLALMSISFNELCLIYPDWGAIVDSIADAHRKRPVQ